MGGLVVRLRRVGRWKYPVYEVVVASQQKRVRGAFFEKIGVYSPMHHKKFFFISYEKLAFWLLKGAQIRKKVGRLLGNLSSIETISGKRY